MGSIEDAVEAATQEIGRSLWKHLERRTPSILERRWWDDRILSWAMQDESVKVQMFRFIDVLPTLRNRDAITRHLQEYFDEVNEHLPGAVRLALEVSQPESILGRALAMTARRNAMRMAKRFIAGTEVDEVLQSVKKLRRQGYAFTLDLLGEAIISEDEADVYEQSYTKLIAGLAADVESWHEVVRLDRDSHGPIPRINVSIKLSALYSQFNPTDPAGTLAGVRPRLERILRCAQEHGAYVHVDMEHYAFKDLTLAIFKEVLNEKEFRDFEDVGIVIQAYLPEAERDLLALREWVAARGTPVWVRLVKGAYWDFETVIAKQRGWPVPVFQRKWQSDDNYERQSRFLMENYQTLRPALASHNMRSLAHGIAWARELKVPQADYEIQMLFGMGTEQAQLLSEQGHRVRVYTPFGELIPGMAYLVRRLLENTSNDSFLRASFAENVSLKELMMKPADHAAAQPPLPALEDTEGFTNEPLTDFSLEASRTAMQDALEAVVSEFGRDYPLQIGGQSISTKIFIESRNPARSKQIVGRAARATKDHAQQAVAAARKAFPAWSRTDAQYRTEYLELVAAQMRDRRFELAAWEVYECGKPWAEADADVAEAIDFCEYYAAQMRELGVPRSFDVPGEENEYFYRPRGVCVVIAPWNFPLAILTGMTVAAIVTGNTVIMKPAEQSPVIAAKLQEIFDDVRLPSGVLNFLPGVGEEVGVELVNHPDVNLIAFTGSQPVGLAINEQAAHTLPAQDSVKRVIAEMGGKNAIIVDDDANLDEAVQGVIASAFGYAGQKCSACSRAVVLESAYDDFVKRLVQAVKSLKIGQPELPGTFIGPVIDAEAKSRIEDYIALGHEEGTLAVAGDVSALTQGYFVAPHVFVDVPPTAKIAQQEIFGPILAVIKARNFDEALQIANGTRYALTGGVYSRSPANLRKARQGFDVGNLYLNRPITGALVERHPFGGFKMSGIGSKAGGPDYLLQFLIPMAVSENTLRRGFAPPEEGSPTGAAN